MPEIEMVPMDEPADKALLVDVRCASSFPGTKASLRLDRLDSAARRRLVPLGSSDIATVTCLSYAS
eukprot:scaffold110355_cov31-Tisochrysis_lutea.AAC.10